VFIYIDNYPLLQTLIINYNLLNIGDVVIMIVW
jgi:hypothetical protein